MTDWYVYYRIMRNVRNEGERLELQDVICEFRERAWKSFPEATEQDIQDFFEHLSRNDLVTFTEREARHLVRMEHWGESEVSQ